VVRQSGVVLFVSVQPCNQLSNFLDRVAQRNLASASNVVLYYHAILRLHDGVLVICHARQNLGCSENISEYLQNISCVFLIQYREVLSLLVLDCTKDTFMRVRHDVTEDPLLLVFPDCLTLGGMGFYNAGRNKKEDASSYEVNFGLQKANILSLMGRWWSLFARRSQPFSSTIIISLGWCQQSRLDVTLFGRHHTTQTGERYRHPNE